MIGLSWNRERKLTGWTAKTLPDLALIGFHAFATPRTSKTQPAFFQRYQIGVLERQKVSDSRPPDQRVWQNVTVGEHRLQLTGRVWPDLLMILPQKNLLFLGQILR